MSSENGDNKPALVQLVEVLVVGLVQEMGGQRLVESKDPIIQQFCEHCDFCNNRQGCSAQNQGKYVYRNWCGWSNRNGKRLGSVTISQINAADGTEFRREDLAALDAYLSQSQ